MAANRALALAARDVLCQTLNVPRPSPNEMVGSLAVVPLPPGDYQRLQTALLEHYRIEVPIIPYPTLGYRQIRISAQVYNSLTQYHELANALLTLLDDES